MSASTYHIKPIASICAVVKIADDRCPSGTPKRMPAARPLAMTSTAVNHKRTASPA